ncbi:MAG: hypothetical protein KGL43_17045, partial [Burkholderiales bacterium]|nr:hypothetical protein [Burkholderiales bacterium]
MTRRARGRGCLSFLLRRCGWIASIGLAGCAAGSHAPPANPAQQDALASNQIAARDFARGDLNAARRRYEHALAAAQSVEDFELAATALLNLAQVESAAGRPAAAMARVDTILASPTRYGAAMQARAAARKALLELDRGDSPAALHWSDEAERACAAPCELDAVVADLRAALALRRGD